MLTPPARRLAARQQKLRQELARLGPVLRASLIRRYVQCGKPGCRCARGHKHGPLYYLTISYAQGRTRQLYLPRSLRPLAEAWIGNYRRALGLLERLSEINLRLLRRREPEAAE